MRVTGFWEMRSDAGEEVRTTVGPIPVDELMERIRARLAEAPAGSTVRIDLIVWDDE